MYVLICQILNQCYVVPPHESTTIQDEDSYSDVEEYFAELSEELSNDEQEMMKNKLSNNLTCSATSCSLFCAIYLVTLISNMYIHYEYYNSCYSTITNWDT